MKLYKLYGSFPELKISRDGEFSSTVLSNSAHDMAILSYIMDKRYMG